MWICKGAICVNVSHMEYSIQTFKYSHTHTHVQYTVFFVFVCWLQLIQ